MDAADFDRWYEASYPRIVGQLTALLGSRAEAQDCVQDAFIRAWDHRLHLEAQASMDAWVRTTAYRLGVSRWRRFRRGLELGYRALPDPAAPAELSDVRADLVAALRKLPEGQRQVVVLHYLADRTIAQIATEIGVAEGTVKARLHHARHALADLLTDTTTGAAT
ncbi:MAG: SigE family RNA polymerase sigma factor [Dermatophilaceae bacterium]